MTVEVAPSFSSVFTASPSSGITNCSLEGKKWYQLVVRGLIGEKFNVGVGEEVVLLGKESRGGLTKK